MNVQFTIYCHTNRVNGKRYVGQTMYSMEKRWQDHVSSAKSRETKGCRVFISAIRKYGADAFDHQILEVVSTQEDANLFEALWIEQMGCRVPFGYNINLGGNGPGRIHDDTKRLMAEASRIRWQKMTAEERSASPPAESLRAWWQQMTAEERGAFKQRLAEGLRSQWQKMTPEERSARQVSRQKTVSPDRRSATVVKSWETRRARYGQDGVRRTKLPEERSAAIKMGWANMSPEARAERVRKVKEGVRKAREAKVPRLIRINLLSPHPPMTAKLDNVIRLRKTYEGPFEGLRSRLDTGRYEIVTNGPSPEFGFIGSDPYGTNAYTGLVVPATPSGSIGNARYLFMLARASFGVGERSPDKHGVRLVGIRQYAELIARLPARVSPLATDVGPPTGSTVTFRREILSPFWHPPDGDISWHVMLVAKGQRDGRNPSNTDGFIYQDSTSPSLLYQTTAPYVPPNGGRPWGSPIVGGSLGNIHELRYPWRTTRSERVLDIPIPVPCDVVFFASVRQNDPALNPTLTDCTALSALSDEDRFLVTYNNFAQYGSIAGSLVFEENLDEDVP